ncbi:MAG: DUF2062 domain-containing protein [Gammaproteobacteria bacterium]|nr:DUF2062 domain-containing protein [Gammaproteobacteria bacterium]
MPRKFLRRILPGHDTVRGYRQVRWLGGLLHDPNLWHLNRRSVAGATAIAIFIGFLPVPGQTLLAAGAAIVLRANLPISAVLVWFTNPFTMPPLFYLAYRTGVTLLDRPPTGFHFEFSLGWFMNEMLGIWQPLLLGCLILGTLGALLGYSVVRLAWRLHVLAQLTRRRTRPGAPSHRRL